MLRCVVVDKQCRTEIEWAKIDTRSRQRRRRFTARVRAGGGMKCQLMPVMKRYLKYPPPDLTSGSAMAEGPRDSLSVEIL